MSSEAFVIPMERLPAGFAERIDVPPDPPAVAVPAATAVLLRDGPAGPEVLLLRRTGVSGFVPGAYVFPGGRVDEGDGAPSLVGRAGALAAHPSPEYWIAAARELFEESGVLVARWGRDRRVVGRAELEVWRNALLDDERSFADILDAADVMLAVDEMVHCAHWITPAAEPRRYDTHFFLAALPPGMEVRADAREMTDARWVTALGALAQFSEGELPMVFPTVKMLEALVGFDTVERTLAAFRDRDVQPIEPRLVRTAHGIGIVIDHDEEKGGA